MPAAPQRPDEATLRQFLLGQLSGPDAEHVERFVEANPDAANTLAAMSTDDALTSALRGAKAVEEIDPKVRAAMAQLERLINVQDERTTTNERMAESLAEPSNDGEETEDALTFLAPAKGPDELGWLGGYRILRVLGMGGMGMVLDAEDPKLGRHVAIKVMRPRVAGSQKAVKRFLQEARAAATVSHDHIIPIWYIGEDNGVPYIVMPFLKGESLDARIKREGRLPAAEIARIGRETAEGLAEAHEAGLTHRDIKPANLWLEAPRGRVKILDFGLARLTGDEAHLTQSGAIVGTPAFMAPEQARGQGVDARSDLFSLGAMLYRLATGRNPFGGTDTMSMLMSLANDTPAHPRSLNAELPAQLADLIVRLLQKDPVQRPKSAREVIALLTPPTVEALPSDSGELRDQFAFDQDDNTQVDAVPMADVLRSPKPKRGTGLLIGVAIALLILIGGGGLAAYKLVFETKDGTLIVEINDKDTEARFKNGELQIIDADGKVKYTVKPSDKNAKVAPGEYKVRVSDPNGLDVDTPEFTMKNGGQVVVKVTAKAPAAIAKVEPDKSVPTTSNYALALDGATTWVQLPFKDDRDGPWTIEAWVRPGTLNRMATIAAAFAPPRGLGFSVFEGQLEAAVSFADAPTWGTAKTGRPLDEGRLQHVAAAFDGQMLRVFLDGKPVGDVRLSERHAPSGQQFCLGGWQGKDLFTGVIDEVRFSRSARYVEAFIPSPRFTADKDTLALYHCDEGVGDVLKDSSGHNHHGKIAGAKWVQGDGGADADRDAIDWLIAHGADYGFTDDKGYHQLKAGQPVVVPTGATRLNSLLLTAVGFTTDAELTRFRTLKALNTIVLVDTPVTDAGLAHLAGLTQMTHLYLTGTKVTDKGLVHLENFKNLQVLHLSRAPVTEVGVKKLTALLPQCAVTYDGGTIGPNAPVPLTADQRTSLEWVLKASGFIKISANGTETIIRSGGTLPDGPFTVIELNFDGVSAIDDAALNNLRNVPSVDGIFNLGGTKITDTGLAKLPAIPGLVNIRDLPMSKCKTFTDAGLAVVPKLPKLETLGLWATNITDAGLKHLSGTKLKTLGVHGCKGVTDEGLKHLATCRDLKVLYLGETGVTKAGVHALKRQLPACEITWNEGTLWPIKAAVDPKAIDLLDKVDPVRDAVRGVWERQGGEFTGRPNGTGNPTLEVPYQPPDEYDYVVEFTRTSGALGVSLALTRNGRAFEFSLAVSGIRYGFNVVDGKSLIQSAGARRGDLSLENGKRHVVKVEVRKDRVAGYLNGQLVTELKTDYQNLTPPGTSALREPTLLGVACSPQVSMTIHRIAVVEVTGKGKLGRPDAATGEPKK